MQKETMTMLVEAADQLGYDVRGREDYSGRGMFGETTCGVVAEESNQVMLSAMFAAYEFGTNEDIDSFDQFLEDMSSLCQDSMGLNTIYY